MLGSSFGGGLVLAGFRAAARPVLHDIVRVRYGLAGVVDLALVVQQPGVDAPDQQLVAHQPARAPLR